MKLNIRKRQSYYLGVTRTPSSRFCCFRLVLWCSGLEFRVEALKERRVRGFLQDLGKVSKWFEFEC